MSSDLQRALDRQRSKPPIRVERALDVATGRPIPKPRSLGLIDKARLISVLIKLIRNPQTLMKSWKTTFFGSGGLFMIWAPVVAAALDGDPSTVPAYGLAFTASLPCLGLLFSKDHNVTGGVK